jgi:hypothetical protein
MAKAIRRFQEKGFAVDEPIAIVSSMHLLTTALKYLDFALHCHISFSPEPKSIPSLFR